MDEDKLRYSDIIEPDDSLERLVAQLAEVSKEYEKLIKTVQKDAKSTASAIKGLRAKTVNGTQVITEVMGQVDKLSQAFRSFYRAQTDVGKQIAWLKAQTADYNKATVEQRRYVQQVSGSYDRIKSDLRQAVALYKSLSAEERNSSETGQRLLQNIHRYREQLSALDAQLRPHIVRLSEVEKAEQKLAFLRSEEGQRLFQIQAEIRGITDAKNQEARNTYALEAAERKLAFARSEENTQLKLYSTQIHEANQIAKYQAIINNSAEGSYNRLAAQYELNKIKLNSLSAEVRNNSQAGRELEVETKALYYELVRLQEAAGSSRGFMREYKRSWDGLGFSISQLTRELPALTVSANTFFLGISNNIPMVVDEIIKLQTRNKLLAEQGEAQINITKQIVKSLFSWNTILVVVLTVLAMYGKEITAWIGNLFKGDKAVASLTDRLKALNKELENGTGDYGKNVVSVKKLKDEWLKLKTEAEKNQWIKDNQSEFNKWGVSIQSVAEAENAIVKGTPSILKAMKLRAQAAAAESLATKKYEEAFIQEQERKLAELAGPDFWAKALYYTQGSQSPTTGAPQQKQESLDVIHKRDLQRMADKAEALMAEGDAYYDMAQAAQLAADAELRAAGINLFNRKTEGDKDRRTDRDPAEKIYSAQLKARRAYLKQQDDLEEDSFKKRRLRAWAEYEETFVAQEEELRKLEKILNDEENAYRDLSEEEKRIVSETQGRIFTIITNAQNKLRKELTDIDRDTKIANQKLFKEAIALRLESAEEGSAEELRLKMSQLDAEEQLELLQNEKLVEAERKNIEDIKAKYNKARTQLKTDYEINTFDALQELEAARFESERRTDKEIKRLSLRQERDRWNKLIDLAEKGSLVWSDTQIDTAKALVQKLNRELSELDDFGIAIQEKGLGGALLESLGFDDDQIDVLKDTYDMILGYLSDIADAYVETAEKAVEAAEKQVESAQAAYDAEVEARNNGYAHKVTTAKKELEEEKRNKEKQTEILRKAQEAQEGIETAQQTMSLITAVANIWATFTKMGPVGYALAALATAGLFGTFAASKIQAKQVATASYGDGGYEFLEGGSHASGNDIPIGITTDGKQRKAEGGETLAIFNKKQTKKYRGLIPDIVDSINKGIFEDKFGNAFNVLTPEQQAVVVSSSIDTSNIEQSLRKIITNQDKAQYYLLPDGSLVIIKGNVKRIIKKS